MKFKVALIITVILFIFITHKTKTLCIIIIHTLVAWALPMCAYGDKITYTLQFYNLSKLILER